MITFSIIKVFADPFNTAVLVVDAKMHAGFRFEVYDRRIVFDSPADLYDMLMFIGDPARYVVHSVRSKTLEEVAAATSTQRLSLIAGKYVGKDDPVAPQNGSRRRETSEAAAVPARDAKLGGRG